MNGKIRHVRAFGWQLDYRPDGWLPFSVRMGKRPDWHVLHVGRFGCVALGRLAPLPRSVTVTLEADTTAYVAAIHDLQETWKDYAHRRRIDRERRLGLAQVGQLLDDWCYELGLDPLEAWRVPRWEESGRTTVTPVLVGFDGSYDGDLTVCLPRESGKSPYPSTVDLGRARIFYPQGHHERTASTSPDEA